MDRKEVIPSLIERSLIIKIVKLHISISTVWREGMNGYKNYFACLDWCPYDYQ